MRLGLDPVPEGQLVRTTDAWFDTRDFYQPAPNLLGVDQGRPDGGVVGREIDLVGKFTAHGGGSSVGLG